MQARTIKCLFNCSLANQTCVRKARGYDSRDCMHRYAVCPVAGRWFDSYMTGVVYGRVSWLTYLPYSMVTVSVVPIALLHAAIHHMISVWGTMESHMLYDIGNHARLTFPIL